MKQMKWGARLIMGTALLLLGCASVEAVWKTLPEVKQTSYENAWSVVVGCVSEKFDLEVTDSGSGYLRSAWKVNKDFLGQNQERTRITVRIESREPLKIKLKAERQTFSSWTHDWVDAGNNEKIEKQILEELSARLK
jgi:LEA14-like dessication related protein